MSNHENLRAWQHAHELSVEVYAVSRHWPAEERYGLIGQSRRAAASVGANIAEGVGKGSKTELRRYLGISLGSLGELENHLRLARDVGLMDEATWIRVNGLRKETARLTHNLRKAIR